MKFFSSLTELVSPYLQLLGWLSLGMFLLSLAVLPMVLTKIPTDYYLSSKTHKSPTTKIHAFHYSLYWIARNLVAVTLFLAGLLMLVLPGQGLLTILFSLFVADFPGKKSIERNLIAIPAVYQSINWIREKRGVERLLPPA